MKNIEKQVFRTGKGFENFVARFQTGQQHFALKINITFLN